MGLRSWGGAIVALALAPAAALAGGVGFPDSQAIFAPADRPDEIIVATTLGLLISEDGGGTWAWSCEHGNYPLVDQWPYQLGPPPRDRLFAISGGLEYSDDGACTWTRSGGLAAGGYQIGPLFFDPNDADRVLASADLPDGDGGYTFAVLASVDGGASFDRVTYESADGFVSSLAIAKADPMTVYMTVSAGDQPTLVRSDDGGASWQTLDLSSALGRGRLSILDVDPLHADRLFLHLLSTSGDAIVVATNRGTVAPRTLSLPAGSEVAFLRASEGTLLVSAFANRVPTLFRSDDDGDTFTAIPGPPHIHGLAERAGVYYAAISAIDTEYELATSTDHGTNWRASMTFQDVRAIIPCAKAACQQQCSFWVDNAVFLAATCSADLPPRDAGNAIPDAGPADATPIGDSDGPRGKLASSRGCRCALGAERDASGAAAGVIVAALLWMGRRQRFPRRVCRGTKDWCG